ncbi:hypothetical protein ACNHYB_06165 [Isoptericola jiangsuensis]|uniref:hypothetical protein n=1 Tax=Isoptericola jiangsuensis TaxID=548579 RepID=UPI003AADC951
MADLKFPIATAPRKDSKTWTQGWITWDEMLAWLKSPASVKECGGYVLGTFDGERRTRETVVSRAALTLDVDTPDSSFIADAALSLDALLLWHSTYSSTPDARRYRLVIPTDRVMTPDEYRQAAAVVMHRLGHEQFDPGSAQPERFMYKPSAKKPEWFEGDSLAGDPVRVDDLLAEWENLPRESAESLAALPQESKDSDLPEVPVQNPGWVAAMLRNIVFEMTVSDGDVGNRNNRLYGLALRAGRFIARGHLDEAEAREELTEAALLAGLEPGEVERTLSNGLRDGRQHPADPPAPRATTELLALFEATPVLRHIRQAALAQLVSSPALLAMVLGRVLAEVPPEVCLPPVVGGRAALNLGVLPVGGSGSGKSALLSTSRRLLGWAGECQKVELERNVGSGEGIVETFLKTKRVPNPDNPSTNITTKVLVDDPRRILIADEVDALAAQSDRAGATLSATVRSALTGGSLGQENATAERRRHVPEGEYRLVMVVGVQPSRSGALLKDTDAGTPQRFLWVPATDATLSRDPVAWPGELNWSPPVDLPDEIDYPDHIKAEVRHTRFLQATGASTDETKGHLMLLRLKVAAALALLHGEMAITDQWWSLATTLTDLSVETQELCRRALGEQAQKELQNSTTAKARAQAVAEDAVAEDQVRTLANQVLGKVREAGDDGLPKKAVRPRPERRHLLDEAIDHLVASGQVVTSETRARNGGISVRLRYAGSDR